MLDASECKPCKRHTVAVCQHVESRIETGYHDAKVFRFCTRIKQPPCAQRARRRPRPCPPSPIIRWCPEFNGSRFGLPPSSIGKLKGLECMGGKMV